MVDESAAQRTERYSRHLLLPQVGSSGQEKLGQARVLIVGAGGLGAPVLTYLSAAGVGTLGVIDDDVVELSNLQRQVIHETGSIGQPKVESAAAFIEKLNPNTRIITHNERLDSTNVFEIISDYDVIVDGIDNFPTRYLLNDACVVEGKPYVWAAIFQFNAVMSIFHAGHGPCYRCIYPMPPPEGSVPSCAQGGVIGALPGLVGTSQALETIKLILGTGTPLRGTLASFDGLTGRWEYVPIAPSPHCPSCAPNIRAARTRDDVRDEWAPKPAEMVEASDGVHNYENQSSEDWKVDAKDLAAFLHETNAALIDVRTPAELQIVAIAGAENIGLDQILAGAEIGSHSKPVVVMCKSGHRSAQAAAELRRRGYESVHELDGGILRWVEIVAPDQPTY